jgi:hypothetical protein
LYEIEPNCQSGHEGPPDCHNNGVPKSCQKGLFGNYWVQ